MTYSQLVTRFALKDEQITLRDYVNLARLRRMSPEELISYTNDYDKKPEHTGAVRDFTKKWTQLEKDLLAWNMGMELNREPTEEEVEAKLADEILRTGGSHSKRCRAFCYLAHPEWFKKKEQITETVQPNT